MDSHIQTLVEMGFSRDQAEDALKSSGNDLTKAIAYLFGEVDDKGAGTQASPYVVESAPIDSYDSISISNPQDLPDFLGQYASSEAIEAPSLPDRYSSRENDVYENYPFIEEDVEMNDASENDIGAQIDSTDNVAVAEMENIDYGPNVRTSGHLFPVVVGGSRKYRFWVSLVAILAQFTPFAERLLSDDASSPFVAELQRIVYFIRNFRRSSRWYISADSLVTQLLASGGGDEYTDEEAILNAYEHMMLQQSLLREVLESLVESVEEDITKELTVLEIDSDTRRNNLYHTLNELFWQKGFVKFGQIKYTRVAPLVTYQLIGESTSYSMPFELQETVYPEIYSARAENAVGREVVQMHEAERSLQTVTRNLLDLNFFEGKRILSLLRQAEGALGGSGAENGKGEEEGSGERVEDKRTEEHKSTDNKGIDEEKKIDEETRIEDEKSNDQPNNKRNEQNSPQMARDDLARLAHQIENVRANKVNHQNILRKQALGDQLGHYDMIAHECNLQPYDLLGVICGDTRYYIRLDIDTYVQMDERTLVDFEDVQLDVAQITRRGSHLVTLVYGQRDGCATLAEEDSIDIEDSESEKVNGNESEKENGKESEKKNGNEVGNDYENEKGKETENDKVNENHKNNSRYDNDHDPRSEIDIDMSPLNSSAAPTHHAKLGPQPSPQHLHLSSPSLLPARNSLDAPPAMLNPSLSIPASSASTNAAHFAPESVSTVSVILAPTSDTQALQATEPSTHTQAIAQLVIDQFHADEQSVPIHLD